MPPLFIHCPTIRPTALTVQLGTTVPANVGVAVVPEVDSDGKEDVCYK